MKAWLAHDLKAVLVASAAWVAFIATGGAVWGFFIPLALVSLLIPAVLTAVLEGPRLARLFMGVAPNVLAVAVVALIPANPDSWAPLIIQIIVCGTALAFLSKLAMFAVQPASR